MKIAILVLISAALLLAQNKESAPAGPPKSIPKAAVLVQPNLYRYTDADGKVWFYRETPFGISKWEDKPSQTPAAVEEKVTTVVKDLGDRVQFERPTPFGVSKWVRNKSELTAEEKALVEHHNKPSAPADSNPSTKSAEKH